MGLPMIEKTLNMQQMTTKGKKKQPEEERRREFLLVKLQKKIQKEETGKKVVPLSLAIMVHIHNPEIGIANVGTNGALSECYWQYL